MCRHLLQVKQFVQMDALTLEIIGRTWPNLISMDLTPQFAEKGALPGNRSAVFDWSCCATAMLSSTPKHLTLSFGMPVTSRRWQDSKRLHIKAPFDFVGAVKQSLLESCPQVTELILHNNSWHPDFDEEA